MIRRIIQPCWLAAALFAAYATIADRMPGGSGQWPIAARVVLAAMLLTIGVVGFLAGTSPIRIPAHQPWRGFRIASGMVSMILIQSGLVWILMTGSSVVERIGIAAEPWLRPERAASRKDPGAHASPRDPPGNPLWRDSRSRALPTRTNLQLGNRAEVFLRFERRDDADAALQRSVYVSAFSLIEFDRGVWSISSSKSTDLPTGAEGATEFPRSPGRSDTRLIRHEVHHGKKPSGQNLVITLQGTERVHLAPLKSYDVGFVTLPDRDPATTGYRYRAESRSLTLADLPRATPATPRQPPNPGWLTVPDSPHLATHLRELARETAGDSPTSHSLARLESWLRNAFDYSLVTENPRRLDPLENFLISERRGHCEHFAMTAALMLRSIGIPARISYGWSGGTWYRDPGLLVFRGRDAHAWTEVWFEEFGWVVMDPTPPGDTVHSQSRIAPPGEPPPDPAGATGALPTIDAPLPVDRIALAIIAATAGVSLIIMRWRRLAITRGRTTRLLRPHRGYLAAWQTACPHPQPGATLRQQIRNLTPPPPFGEPLIDYHYRTLYGGERADPNAERELERAIHSWRKPRASRE